MSSNESFKILVKEYRKEHVHTDSEHFVIRERMAADFDPARLRGVLDMLINGQSLLDHPGEDSVLFLIRDLLGATEKLTTGDSSARVSFYESPYELVFQRNADLLFLTFYKGGHFPEVIVKDHKMRFAEFVSGIVESCSAIVDQLAEMDESVSEQPLMKWMVATNTRLFDFQKSFQPSGQRGGIHSREVASTRWLRPRNKYGFSFGFKFLATKTDLLSPGRPIGNDLNALLFRGQMVLHARERRKVMGEGFLFLQAEKLLASVTKLLSSWEEGRPMSVRLISEGIGMGIQLDDKDNLTVTFSNQNDEDSMIVINDLTPWEYADAVLGVSREIRRAILEHAPKQRKNIRVETFSKEIRHITAMIKDQQRGTVINEDIDKYKEQLEMFPEYNDETNFANTRGLMFREKWRLEVEGLDLFNTMMCDGITVVTAGRYMMGIENASGSMLWRRDIDKGESRLQAAGRDSFIRVTQTGMVDFLDLHTGTLRWRAELSPRTGGAPVLLVIDQGVLPGIVVTVEDNNNIVALDIRTGEIKWRYSVARGGRFSLRRCGRLLYISSGDIQLAAIDIEDGALVWRFVARAKFFCPVTVSDTALTAFGGRLGKGRAVMHGLDPYSGELRFKKTLRGALMGSPLNAGNVTLIPLRNPKGNNDLAAFDMETGDELWRLPCDGWTDSCSLLALENSFIINMAGGTVQCLDAQTGEEMWNTVVGPTCSDDIPLNLSVFVRNGALFVPADTMYVLNPETGEIIHSLGGEPPVPDMVNVNPDNTILVAEESGHLGLYTIARSLTLLPGGN